VAQGIRRGEGPLATYEFAAAVCNKAARVHATAVAGTGGLTLRAERRGQVCFLVIGGEMDEGSAARLADATERAEAMMRTQPGRIVIDLSGLRSIDRGGARALARAASPAPGRCQVVVRSLRPVLRRVLNVTDTDLDLVEPDLAAAGLPLGPALARYGTAGDLPGSPPRESRDLCMRAAQVRLRSRRAAAEIRRTDMALAVTADKIAAALFRMATQQSAASARLITASQAFRGQATRLRGRAEYAAALEVPPSLGDRYPAADTLQRAIAFIGDRARDDITVADIAGASFVTVRALQMSFRRHLDTTPLGYLRRVRLECAHRDLLDADPDQDTVTGIAARWKFSTASRFSAYYRALYGVLPSHTLHHGQVAAHEQAG
jgi:anti-anti-sigma factor